MTDSVGAPGPGPDADGPGFYEFFAGGGMARAGLGPTWRCLFANDVDAKKAAAYRANWGDDAFRLGDVRALSTRDLPGRADLVWGSFPCQDLSLAGAGAGLNGARSGTFHPFWALIEGLIAEGRAPRLVAVENVCGTLTSRGGRDFEAICLTFARAGYRFGPLVINADMFTPQSRPRLFVIGALDGVAVPPHLLAAGPGGPFHPRGLRRAAEALSEVARAQLVWWRLPEPAPRRLGLADVIESRPEGVAWASAEETRRLLSLMSPVNLAKVEAAKGAGRVVVGTVYRRTRTEADGRRTQRAEVRFDDVAGCLRTPAGGSSRQTLLVVDGPAVRARLISARETARLMGLDDGYVLPARYNEAYHLTGDGVAAPVVAHLARRLFEPILAATEADRRDRPAAAKTVPIPAAAAFP